MLERACRFDSDLVDWMKKKVIIKEEDWETSVYPTKEWNDSVEVMKYEHDYEKKEYIIEYKEK